MTLAILAMSNPIKINDLPIWRISLKSISCPAKPPKTSRDRTKLLATLKNYVANSSLVACKVANSSLALRIFLWQVSKRRIVGDAFEASRADFSTFDIRPRQS